MLRGAVLSAIFFPTAVPDSDLKLVGEDIYFGENPMETLKPINEDEIPDYYKIN